MIAALRGQFQEQQRAVVDVVEQCERLRASMGFMKEVQDCNDADDDNETDDAHVKNDDVHHGHNDDDVYDDVFADWKLLHADDNLHRRTISTPSWHATKTTWLTTPTQSKLAECQHALDYLQALQSHLRMKITTLVETITMLLRRLDRPTGDVSALCGSASLSTVRSLIVTARHLERDVREREERVRELQGRIMDMACGMGRTVPDFRQGGGIDDALLSDEVITELEMLVTSWMDEWNGYREARIQQVPHGTCACEDVSLCP